MPYLDVYRKAKEKDRTVLPFISIEIDTGVLQEVVFIKTDLEYEALKLQVGRLMYYVSERHMFYTLLGDSLLEVNVRTGAKKELVKDMPADLIYVSRT